MKLRVKEEIILCYATEVEGVNEDLILHVGEEYNVQTEDTINGWPMVYIKGHGWFDMALEDEEFWEFWESDKDGSRYVEVMEGSSRIKRVYLPTRPFMYGFDYEKAFKKLWRHMCKVYQPLVDAGREIHVDAYEIDAEDGVTVHDRGFEWILENCEYYCSEKEA